LPIAAVFLPIDMAKPFCEKDVRASAAGSPTDFLV
jgi:hypothetical protein